MHRQGINRLLSCFAALTLIVGAHAFGASVLAQGNVPICDQDLGCMTLSPSAPTSGQKVAISLSLPDIVPSNNCFASPTILILGNTIYIYAYYDLCDSDYFLLSVRGTPLQLNLQPLAAGHYDVVFRGSPDSGLSRWVLINDSNASLPGRISIKGSLDVADTFVAPNYQGLWFNPAESGWGIHLVHQGDLIFATWFTYDRNGKGLWLAMTAARTVGETFVGAFYETHGPPFDSKPYPAIGSPGGATGVVVGQGSLAFDALGANATFAYAVDGVSQTKAITREQFGTVPRCVFGVETDLTVAQNYTDLWWADPAGSEAGWGINLAHQGFTIFATWFTYDHDGTPMWLVSTTGPTWNPTSYTGTIYRTVGPPFNAAPFPPIGAPGGATGTAVGTLFLVFNDGSHGVMAVEMGDFFSIKPITREVLVSPGTVCQ